MGGVLLQFLIPLRPPHDSILGDLRPPSALAAPYELGTTQIDSIDTLLTRCDEFLSEVRAHLLQA